MTDDLLAHRVTGGGAPLVLLNGGAMTYAAWEPLAPTLEASFRLVRCDFRGQLLSPGEPPSTVSAHVEDVLRLMDALSIEAAHVAGASFGALVGLMLAATAPSRVRSLVCISATDRVTPDMQIHGDRLREACRARDGARVFDLIDAATWSPAFREANAPMLAARRQAMQLMPALWFTGLERILDALDGLDLRPILPRIACPTLVVGGDADLTFPIEHSRELAGCIRGAALVAIDGGSHGVCLERAAQVADLVAGFAGALSARA